MDNEDPDQWTYEVDWDNGAHGMAVREYHLEFEPTPPPPGAPAQQAQAALRRNCVIQYEANQAARDVPAVTRSIRRLTAYIRQAADTKEPGYWVDYFQSVLVPAFDEYMYLSADRQERIIIPDTPEGWNRFHTELDQVHDVLMPHRSAPGVEAVIQAVDEYHKMIQPENTDKTNLFKLTDDALRPQPTQLPDQEPGEKKLGDEAKDVLKNLPAPGVAIDELLDRWKLAQDPAVKKSIEERIKKLHELSLQAYLRITSGDDSARKKEFLEAYKHEIINGKDNAYKFACELLGADIGDLVHWRDTDPGV